MKPKQIALIAAFLAALLGILVSARPEGAAGAAVTAAAAIPEPPPAAVSPPVAAAAPAAEAAADPARPPAIFEQSIYIPYEKLRRVFEREGRGVFLPYEKFQELWQAARERTAPPPRVEPPVPALILEMESEATVARDVLHVTARLTIEVLKEGWSEIPLRLRDAAVTRAALDGNAARLLFDPAAGHAVLVHKEGKEPRRMALELEFAKAYAKAPGQNSVSFEAPQAPVSKWEVRVPERGVRVSLYPMIAATEIPPETGTAQETVVRAFVGAAPEVRIEWTPKAEGATGLEALASVDASHEVRIEEGVTRTRAQLIYQISRAELSELVLEAPADQKVVNVYDPNVRQWSVEPVDGGQRIRAQLFEPARARQAIAVELEQFAGSDRREVDVPLLRAAAAARQRGIVVVQVGPGLRAEVLRQSGLFQIDAAELPPELARVSWGFAYRYAALPYQLAFSVETIEPRVVVDSLVEAWLRPEELTLSMRSTYTIELAGTFQLELDVPEGYEVRRVRGFEAPEVSPVEVDSHHLDGAQQTHLVVNLARKAMGRVGLAVELHRALEEPDLLAPTGKAASIAIGLPRAAPASIDRESGHLVVYAPENLRLNPDQLSGLRAVPSQEALRGAASQAAPPDERPVLAYAYTEDEASISVKAERRRPHVTARQLLVARIDPGVVRYEATIFCQILYSGVKSLRLDLPAAVAEKARLESAALRHQRLDPAATPDLGEGYVAWELAGETELLGEPQVRLVWEDTLASFDLGKSLSIQVPRIVPHGVDRAWGQIVLVKAETIDLRPAQEVGGLQPIDPQHDLMAGAAVPGAASAFEFHGDWTLPLVATRYEVTEVKRTSVERGLLRMVVTRSRTLSVQALYRVRSAEQRLVLQLPGEVLFDTDPLRINGRPVPLERGEAGQYFIPLVGQDPNQSFFIELRYALDRIRFDAPVFAKDPAVQRVYLAAYLPQERILLGSRGPWSSAFAWRWHIPWGWRIRSERTAGQLLDWVAEGLDLPGDRGQSFAVDGKAYIFSALNPPPPPAGALRLTSLHRSTFRIIVLLVVLAGGVGLVRARPFARWLAIAAVLVLLVLFGLFLPTLTRQLFGNMAFVAGLLLMALWAIWRMAAAHLPEPPPWKEWLAVIGRLRPRRQRPGSGPEPPAAAPGAIREGAGEIAPAAPQPAPAAEEESPVTAAAGEPQRRKKPRQQGRPRGKPGTDAVEDASEGGESHA